MGCRFEGNKATGGPGAAGGFSAAADNGGGYGGAIFGYGGTDVLWNMNSAETEGDDQYDYAGAT